MAMTRHESDHSIPDTHAFCRKSLGQTGDRFVQIAPGQALPGTLLCPEYDGVAVIPSPQQILGKVQACIGKKPRTRHLPRILHDPVTWLADHVAELPYGSPECLRMGNGPAMQSRVVRCRVTDLLPDQIHKAGQPACRGILGGRGPDRISHGGNTPDSWRPRGRWQPLAQV
jgi:hypothetical protein